MNEKTNNEKEGGRLSAVAQKLLNYNSDPEQIFFEIIKLFYGQRPVQLDNRLNFLN